MATLQVKPAYILGLSGSILPTSSHDPTYGASCACYFACQMWYHGRGRRQSLLWQVLHADSQYISIYTCTGTCPDLHERALDRSLALHTCARTRAADMYNIESFFSGSSSMPWYAAPSAGQAYGYACAYITRIIRPFNLLRVHTCTVFEFEPQHVQTRSPCSRTHSRTQNSRR